MNAIDAIERLKQGNSRFVNGIRCLETFANQVKTTDFSTGQAPFAIILGCSDSRVPAEIVFDQGLGDLFVIRVAGNIVAPSQIGSIEYAVEMFGTSLVVVLGHTQCGAVISTLDVLRHPTEQSRNLLSIVNRIKPSVEPLYLQNQHLEPEGLLYLAIRTNILASVEQLQCGSILIEQYVQQGRLTIVGAEYCLEKGEVEFLNE